MTSSHNYSWIWKYRNYVAFIGLGVFLFGLTILAKGVSSVIADPSLPLFMWIFIWITKTNQIRRGRQLAKQVEIVGSTVKVTSYNNKVSEFDLSEISTIKVVKASDSINRFSVKEIVIKVPSKCDCVIPINITNFRTLYKRLKKR